MKQQRVIEAFMAGKFFTKYLHITSKQRFYNSLDSSAEDKFDLYDAKTNEFIKNGSKIEKFALNAGLYCRADKFFMGCLYVQGSLRSE